MQLSKITSPFDSFGENAKLCNRGLLVCGREARVRDEDQYHDVPRRLDVVVDRYHQPLETGIRVSFFDQRLLLAARCFGPLLILELLVRRWHLEDGS